MVRSINLVSSYLRIDLLSVIDLYSSFCLLVSYVQILLTL